MTLHQLLDLGENILDKFKKFSFNHLEVLLVDALPGVVEGKGDTHPAVEEDELEEEKDGEDRVLELAWVWVKYETREKLIRWQLTVFVVQLLLPNEGKGKVCTDSKNHNLPMESR